MHIDKFEHETSNLKIKITKSLFKEHMVNSYHGIGHTVRVMWNAFLIASLDPEVNDSLMSPILYASLIHDLGKANDREGGVHGQNSALLYKSKIEQICGAKLASSILEAVKYHSIDDSKCPSTVRANKIWEILKDADALDRSRLPGRGCNPAFLRNDLFKTDAGREILQFAKDLPSLTSGCSWNEPIDEIVNLLNSIL